MTKNYTSRVRPFLTPNASLGPIAGASQDSGTNTKTWKQRKSFRTVAKPTFQWIRGELIGKGSYGRVYLALNASTGEVMAVKQVELPRRSAAATSQQKEVIDALKFEGETLYELDHPHIVQFLGYEENAERLSIFLEYVPGGTIESCLKQHGPFSENLTKSFTSQILEGLEYLHDQGIIHRDLKSANILVEQTGICKISDFGVSKQVDLLEARAFTGLKGTVFWMAPEVVDSKKAGYDSKVDIWSVGCMIVEMWSGHRPWFGEEIVSVMLKLYQHKSPPPLPSHIQLSPEASDFRDLCFVKLPSERPSAVELRRHRYLKLDPEWAFTPAETEVRTFISPDRPARRSVQRHSSRLSESALLPLDPPKRQSLSRHESESHLRTASHDNTVHAARPPPPLVFITPPSKSTSVASDEVFNWAATSTSHPSATSPSRAQPKKNFYVVNPDSDESDSDNVPTATKSPCSPTPISDTHQIYSQPMSVSTLTISNRFDELHPPLASPPSPAAHSASHLPPPTATSYPTSTGLSTESDGSVWQRPPLPPIPQTFASQDPYEHESPWNRPDLRNVYSHLEEFFPEHDIDKPVVEAAGMDSLFKKRRSIRMLANEHMSKNPNLNRRGTRIWARKIEELIIH